MSEIQNDLIPGYIPSPHLQNSENPNPQKNYQVNTNEDLNNSEIPENENKKEELINIPLISQDHTRKQILLKIIVFFTFLGKKEEEKNKANTSINNQTQENNSSLLSEKKFLLDDELIAQSPVRYQQFITNIDRKKVNLKEVEDVALNYNQVFSLFVFFFSNSLEVLYYNIYQFYDFYLDFLEICKLNLKNILKYFFLLISFKYFPNLPLKKCI